MSHSTTLDKDALPNQDGSSGVLQDSGSGTGVLESGPGSVGNEKLELAVDDFVVDWNGPDDVANPINWPAQSRWAHIIMISVLGLVTYVFPVPGLLTRAPFASRSMR
jgi:hypothetical protein